MNTDDCNKASTNFAGLDDADVEFIERLLSLPEPHRKAVFEELASECARAEASLGNDEGVQF